MTPSHAIYSATLAHAGGTFHRHRGRSRCVAGADHAQRVDDRAELDTNQPCSVPQEPSSGQRLGPSAMSPPGNVWPPQAIGRPNPLWAIPIASLSATRERPIFSPSRRPPLKAAPPAPQQSLRGNEPNRPLLALVGTVAATPEGIAIFQDEKSKDIVRLRTGESHSGWTLTAVKAREVTLSHGHETAVLVIPSPPAQSSPPRK